MRNLDAWGFWHLGGIAVLVPKTPEFSDASFARFGIHEPMVYVSFPPFWLWLPYGVYRVLHAIIQLPLSISFLQIYHLIVDRLGGLIAVFLLGQWLTRKASGRIRPEMGGLIAAAAWTFQPFVLYWTQNLYFADSAVLTPLILFGLTALDRLDSGGRGLALSFLAAWACGTDWYGWVVAVMAIGLLRKRAGPILAGLGVVCLIYGGQLLWLGNRFYVLLDRLLYRTSNNLDPTSGIPAGTGELLSSVFQQWKGYVFALPLGSLPSVLLALGCALLASLPFAWGAFRRPDHRKILGAAWLLFVAAPFIHLMILRQHAATHQVDAFKMSVPVALGWLGITLAAAELPWLRWIPAVALLAVGGIGWAAGARGYRELATTPGPEYRDFSEYLSRTFSSDEVLVSDAFRANWHEPQNLWYLGRMAYSPADLDEYREREVVALEHARLVYLSFKDPPESNPSYPCTTQWQPLLQTYFRKKGFSCEARLSAPLQHEAR
jgi:hypothetical protein